MTQPVDPGATPEQPATAPSPEAQPPVPAQPQKVEPAPVDRNSRMLAELSRREKAAREAEERAKQAFPKYKETIEQTILKDLRENPLQFLRDKAGIEYDDIARQVLKGEEPNPIDPIRSELEALKQQIAEREQREAEYMRQQELARIQEGVHTYVSGAAEQYPLTNAAGEQNAVFVRMLQAEYEGRVLSEEEAAREVEANLESLVKKALENEALRAKFLPAAPTQSPKPRGLSYQDTLQVTEVTERPRGTTPEERMQGMLELIARNNSSQP